MSVSPTPTTTWWEFTTPTTKVSTHLLHEDHQKKNRKRGSRFGKKSKISVTIFFKDIKIFSPIEIKIMFKYIAFILFILLKIYIKQVFFIYIFNYAYRKIMLI